MTPVDLALIVEVERLRGALRPFVDFLNYLEAHAASKPKSLLDSEMISIRVWKPESPYLTVAHLRELRAALEGDGK